MLGLVEARQRRSFNSGGPGRSAIEVRSGPRRHLKSAVARKMPDIVAVELEAGSHHRLALVAAPATMGDLRGAVTSDILRFPTALARLVRRPLTRQVTKGRRQRDSSG